MERALSKAPKAPDPYAVSAAQTSSNQNTANYNADLNRVSQYTPLGNSVYTQTGTGPSGAPLYRQDVSLAPDAQTNLSNQLKQDAQISGVGYNLAKQTGDELANPMDTSGLPALQGSPQASHLQGGLDFSGAPALHGANDFSGDTQRTQNAVYGQYTSRLDPQFNNSQHDLDSQLANQGVVQGSEAWQRAQDQQSRNKNDAYAQAGYNAVQAGSQEQSRLFGNSLAARGQSVGEIGQQGQFANTAAGQQFGMNMQGAGFGNQARAQGLTEGAALRQQPLNELNALRSQSQVTQPTFGQVAQSQAQPTDVAGNIYKSNAIDSANSNAFMNGLFSMGAAGLSAAKFSDRRLKRDIFRIGETARDFLPLYAYRYLWSGKWNVGVMADEVRRVRPAAVINTGRFDMVDYGLIG